MVVSPVLPYTDIPHAGGQYMRALEAVLRDETDLIVLARSTPSTRAAVGRPGCPPSHVMPRRSRHPVARLARRCATAFDRVRTDRDPGAAPLAFAAEILTDRRLRHIVQRADLIDLQWDECIRLLPLFRFLNRRARYFGTFHDVQSQRFDRMAGIAPDTASSRRWTAAASQARAVEARRLGRLDRALVFSPKDADLLLASDPQAPVAVIRPPLARQPPLATSGPTPEPGVGFVGLLSRQENEAGLLWFISLVWPRILAAEPRTILEVAGTGASRSLLAVIESTPGARSRGYVEDLDDFYASVSAAVVPLQQGAGLKFKTVEALAAGVPTIATSVGAEGVGPDHWFAGLTDDPAEFATKVIACLDAPPARSRGVQ